MAAAVHYLGIRHHGPGSARRLLHALDAIKPDTVLIEGPADATALLEFLVRPDMVPPVALLAYVADTPTTASFHPVAEFSPEYQAACWAARSGAQLAFIDLPAAMSLAEPFQEANVHTSAPNADFTVHSHAPSSSLFPAEGDLASDYDTSPDECSTLLHMDPIGAIAYAAGYEDGESWWNDWIETGSIVQEAPITGDRSLQVFESVTEIMMALREREQTLSLQEARREAYMRLAIRAAVRKSTNGVAVVCGAWHIPALKSAPLVAEDRALLRGIKKCRVKMTWVPWSYPKLVCASGYGAGVVAPRWYEHLWRYGAGRTSIARWMVEIARCFRESGMSSSTHAVIEAVRLTEALAQLRGRPVPGFEETRDAAIACLCEGDSALWCRHEPSLLSGHRMGRIPSDVLPVPLLDDLFRHQRRLRLRRETAPGEMHLDLRNRRDLERVTLWHRLQLLNVPWGQRLSTGSEKDGSGERWFVQWNPDFTARLVESVLYGMTIEQAALRRSMERLTYQNRLQEQVALTRQCLEAGLARGVDAGLTAIADSISQSRDGVELLEALPEIILFAHRAIRTKIASACIDDLLVCWFEQLISVLPRTLQDSSAKNDHRLCALLISVHEVLESMDISRQRSDYWREGLRRLETRQSDHPRMSGVAARLLYDTWYVEVIRLRRRFPRALNTVSVGDDDFAEGFLACAWHRLLRNERLPKALDIGTISRNTRMLQRGLFRFRQIWTQLDTNERRQLLDHLLRRRDVPDDLHAELIALGEAYQRRLSVQSEKPSTGIALGQ